VRSWSHNCSRFRNKTYTVCVCISENYVDLTHSFIPAPGIENLSVSRRKSIERNSFLTVSLSVFCRGRPSTRTVTEIVPGIDVMFCVGENQSNGIFFRYKLVRISSVQISPGLKISQSVVTVNKHRLDLFSPTQNITSIPDHS
jgi:hypothetical protein